MCRALGIQRSLRHKTLSVVQTLASSQSQHNMERAMVEMCTDLTDAQDLLADCDIRKRKRFTVRWT